MMMALEGLTRRRGIGLETSILFVKEGARVLMTDISAEALEKAQAKVKQLVPDAAVETKVGFLVPLSLIASKVTQLTK